MYPTSRQFTNVNVDGGGPAAEPATPKIKVSQATVDAIKSAGESKSYGATQYKGVSPEYVEGVKRIYPNAPKKAAAAAQKKTESQRPQSPGPSNLPPSNTPSPRAAEKKAATPAPIKVSQATIDAIKSAGKEKSIGALKYKGVSAEYKEGVRRLYQSPAKPKPKAPANRGGGGGKNNVAM
jgi:hypothetical protein